MSEFNTMIVPLPDPIYGTPYQNGITDIFAVGFLARPVGAWLMGLHHRRTRPNCARSTRQIMPGGRRDRTT